MEITVIKYLCHISCARRVVNNAKYPVLSTGQAKFHDMVLSSAVVPSRILFNSFLSDGEKTYAKQHVAIAWYKVGSLAKKNQFIDQ